MFLYCKLQYLISLIFSIFTPYQTHSACYIFLSSVVSNIVLYKPHLYVILSVVI